MRIDCAVEKKLREKVITLTGRHITGDRKAFSVQSFSQLHIRKPSGPMPEKLKAITTIRSKAAPGRPRPISFPPVQPISDKSVKPRKSIGIIKTIKSFCKKIVKNHHPKKTSVDTTFAAQQPSWFASDQRGSVVIHEDNVADVYRPAFLALQQLRPTTEGGGNGADMATWRSVPKMTPTNSTARTITAPSTYPRLSFESFGTGRLSPPYSLTHTRIDDPSLAGAPTERTRSSLTARPPSVASSIHSSTISGHLDAQLRALNGVFSSIRAAQEQKMEKFVQPEQSPEGMISRASLEMQVGRSSLDLVRRKPVEYVSGKADYVREWRQSIQRYSYTLRQPTTDVRKDNGSKFSSDVGISPKPESHRTDSGISVRSALDSLFLDMQDLSLQELASKYSSADGDLVVTN
ncbi:hypothetical protein HDU85_002458 [Gaertneriomyces sp. JEL0708]|nr:hypothetical protein HDU85_002458 [Gaertneriomyces sp. JEL0708]